MDNPDRVRTIYLGIAANGSMSWNEVKGRVSKGSLFVLVRELKRNIRMGS